MRNSKTSFRFLMNCDKTFETKFSKKNVQFRNSRDKSLVYILFMLLFLTYIFVVFTFSFWALCFLILEFTLIVSIHLRNKRYVNHELEKYHFQLDFGVSYNQKLHYLSLIKSKKWLNSSNIKTVQQLELLHDFVEAKNKKKKNSIVLQTGTLITILLAIIGLVLSINFEVEMSLVQILILVPLFTLTVFSILYSVLDYSFLFFSNDKNEFLEIIHLIISEEKLFNHVSN